MSISYHLAWHQLAKTMGGSFFEFLINFSFSLRCLASYIEGEYHSHSRHHHLFTSPWLIQVFSKTDRLPPSKWWKIAQKVSFKIASESSCVYVLTGIMEIRKKVGRKVQLWKSKLQSSNRFPALLFVPFVAKLSSKLGVIRDDDEWLVNLPLLRRSLLAT